MIKQIITVEKSKDGTRTYGTDIKGEPLFPRVDAVRDQMKAGCYGNVVEQLQTKTFDEKGNLVDLPTEEQRRLQIVTAVWPTRDEAIKANAEEALFEAHTKAYVSGKTIRLNKQFSLEGTAAL